MQLRFLIFENFKEYWMLNTATMELEEAKQSLIEAWGTLGGNWGINRAMAKIHILLMITPDPLSAEEIMSELNISRGNANLNIRALIDWGLVSKKLVPGERREYFYPVKDMWELLRIVAAERRKREVQPVARVLDDVSNVEGNSDEAKEFLRVVKGLKGLIDSGDMVLDILKKLEKNRFVKGLRTMR